MLWEEQSPQLLPAVDEPDVRFVPWSWSPDGRVLAGTLLGTGDRRPGICLYFFDGQRFEGLTGSGYYPAWLQDSRRLLFADGAKVNLIDRYTKRVKEIHSVTSHLVNHVFISGDNRTIYFGVEQEEGGIWLASLK
jgi:hypothetical protein